MVEAGDESPGDDILNPVFARDSDLGGEKIAGENPLKPRYRIAKEKLYALNLPKIF